MAVLWLKFAEDSSLPPVMDAAARAKFEAIFDMKMPDSPWGLALRRLGVNDKPNWRPLISWHGNTPYINWSHLVQVISAGVITVQRDSNAGFGYQTSYRLSNLLALIRAQWNLARYILNRLEPHFVVPEDNQETISESIALGLAMLALTMRLPAHSEADLAAWLADPSALPAGLKRNLKQLQGLQQLRTKLTPPWKQAFAGDSDAPHEDAPEFFWDTPPATAPAVLPMDSSATSWKGLAVAGSGVVTGRAVFIARVKNADLSAIPSPRILVFPLARPETVELFEQADAVLFGEGGVMSHACTIAREMNLPCITGLGKGFIARMKAGETLWLSVDITQGSVTLVTS